MNFRSLSFKHLRYEIHIQYILIFMPSWYGGKTYPEWLKNIGCFSPLTKIWILADDFRMIFSSLSSKHLRYEFHIQYILIFYAKLIWWKNIPWVAEKYGMFLHLWRRYEFQWGFSEFQHPICGMFLVPWETTKFYLRQLKLWNVWGIVIS
jgi:hypothetical protein